MIKVILRLSCGVGMDSADSYLVTEEQWKAYTEGDISLDDLADFAWQEAIQFAESYGIYPESDMPEDYDEDSDDWESDQYSDDIEGWFELYEPDEHDGLMIGTQREWDWKKI